MSYANNRSQECSSPDSAITLYDREAGTATLTARAGRPSGVPRLTILGADEEGLGRVLGVRAFEGVPYNEQLATVVWLHCEWHFRRIYVDASAHALVDELRARGLPVEAISFSLQGKVELHSRLKAAFEARRLTIPRHLDLLRELAAFEYAITPKGNLTLHGGRDDHVDSLALAAKPLTRPRPDYRPGPPIILPPRW